MAEAVGHTTVPVRPSLVPLVTEEEWVKDVQGLSLRNVRGISNTMLSKTLRELEESGLVRRAEYLEIPVRVEYEITERARNLQPILAQLVQWEMKAHEG